MKEALGKSQGNAKGERKCGGRDRNEKQNVSREESRGSHVRAFLVIEIKFLIKASEGRKGFFWLTV